MISPGPAPAAAPEPEPEPEYGARSFDVFHRKYEKTFEGEADIDGRAVTFRMAWGGSTAKGAVGISSDPSPKWKLLHSTSLRDMCACAACRDPSSGQKKFRTTRIPLDISVRDVRQSGEGLSFTFDRDVEGYEDGVHETTVPWSHVNEWIDRRLATPTPMAAVGEKYPWTSAELGGGNGGGIRKFDFEDYLKDDETMWNAVIDLRELGITIVKNVPRDENAVADITTRIANIRETLYGRTFDVRAKPDAENVAYTSEALDLHQDLLYLQVPPKIQVLHCLDNSCEGGESIFSDSYRAGRLLWLFRDRLGVQHLGNTRVPYAYDKFGHNYRTLRRVITTSKVSERLPAEFANVWWSPPFQGSVKMPVWNFHDWIQAARVLESLVAGPAAVWTYKLREGECVLFDNVRVLHGRRAFRPEAGGARWLRGAYIAPDDFASRASQVPPELLREYQSGGRFSDVGAARRRFVKPWEEGNPEIAQVERMIDGVQTVNDTEPIVEDK